MANHNSLSKKKSNFMTVVGAGVELQEAMWEKLIRK